MVKQPLRYGMCAATIVVGLVLLVAAPPAAANKPDAEWLAHVEDSLSALAAGTSYPPEPTIQEIIDSLGYDLNADTDAIDLNIFCLFPQSAWRLVAEYTGAATTHEAGWYLPGQPADSLTVLSAGMLPGDSVMVGGALSQNVPLFHRRDAGTSWFTETGFNYDGNSHHKVYPLPDGSGYLIFWEDLAWISDGDYNDMVFEVSPENLPPTISFALARPACGGDPCPESYICEGDSVCIEIAVSDNGCIGDTVTVDMLAGEGDFVPVTGVGEVLTYHCWIPTTEGLKQFIFEASDNLGLSTEGTYWVTVAFDDTPPDLPDPVSTSVHTCLPELVCVDFPLSNVEYDHLWIEPLGYYDEIEENVCFEADTAGTYTVWVIAADTCGNEDTSYVEATVTTTAPPTITVQSPEPIEICEPVTLCATFSTFDPEEDIDTIWTEDPGILNLNDSTLCFYASTAGITTVPVYVVDSCGAADTGYATFEVTTGGQVTLNCPGDMDTLMCDVAEICFPVTTEGDEAIITVSPPATYNEATGEVCFTPDPISDPNNPQTYTITVTAQSECGFDECTVNVTVHGNRAPQVTLPPDYELAVCEPELICVPYACGDPDLNLTSCDIIEAPVGYQDADVSDGNEVCFTPDGSGTYRIIVEATDDCGLLARDTIDIDVSLNSAPEITGETAVSIGLCGPDSVCMPVSVTDIDNNINSITTSLNAVYKEADGLLCFYADADGVYNLQITVEDACGLTDVLDVAATISLDAPPEITCPDPVDTLLCQPGQVCIDLDLPVVSGDLTVTVSPIGTYDAQLGQICFDADTAGLYALEVAAEDTCGGADTCIAEIGVAFNQPPVVIGETAHTTQLCAGDEFCFEVSCSDPDGNLESCDLVEGPGTYTGGQVCFTPPAAGTYTFEVQATDDCGLTATSQITVTVTMDLPPEITANADISQLLCQPGNVCVLYEVMDPEGGPITLTADHGVIDEQAGTWCVFFNSDSILCADIIAEDLCGNQDTATVCFTIDYNQEPQIIMDAAFDTLVCEPGTVCLPFEVIEPEGISSIEIEPFGTVSQDTSEICVDVDTAGTYAFRVIVRDECASNDTAGFVLQVGFNRGPTISGPPDASLFFCAPQEVCVPGFEFDDPDQNIATIELTTGTGVFDDQTGELCFTVDTAGTYCFEVAVTDACGSSDTHAVCFTMYDGVAPVITLEEQVAVDIPEPGEVCFPVQSDDADTDQLFDLELTSGSGNFPTQPGRNTITGTHCFDADTAGCYPFVFTSTDSCGLFDVESTTVCVTITPPDSQYVICIDTVETLNSSNVDIDVIVYEAMEMGGFDLLICFDQSVLSFNHAVAGSATADWEYFTYRGVVPEGCSDPCGVNAVHLIGVADMNDGSNHPPEDAYLPKGTLATLNFGVTSDLNTIGQCVPVYFCWYDCTDNTISSRTGDTTFVVYGIDDILPEQDCLAGGKDKFPLEKIEFCDGRICIIPPEDDRGDINLNGLANEIGDAVLFTNYFVYGNSVWHPIYYENQWLASDVNADGIPKTVADLVYLIRIITGDAEPIGPGSGGRLTPFDLSVIVGMEQIGNDLVLYSDAPLDVGGLFVQLRGIFPQDGHVTFADEVAHIRPKYRLTPDECRLLIAGISEKPAFLAGRVELARIPNVSEKQVAITAVEASSFDGTPLNVEFISKSVDVPDLFALRQNYPNPFNAKTIIELALPQASDYRLTVFNILGQKVRELSGSAEPGILRIEWDGKDADGQHVSSGVYFYRAIAGDMSDTRKMLLIK